MLNERRSTESTPIASVAPLSSGAQRFPHLFTPLAIGTMTIANRFVMAPMTTNFAAADGAVTDELCDYLALRGAGGFALVITENMGVHASGRVMPKMVMIDDDRHIAGLTRLARAVQASGAKIVGQLSHCGRQSKSKFTGMPLVAASPIPCPLNREMPRELSTAEVEQMVQAFVAGAVRLEQAGYDGVEVHGAHGYLPSGFLSAYSNTRTDRYGGSLENRMRFLLEIVEGIKARVKIPLIVRISADEFVPGGNTLAQTTRIARALQAHGVQAISVSVGVYESFNTQSMVSGEQEGRWLPLAQAIKQEVSVPVFGVGRIKRPEVAEAAIAAGQCDVALFGRAAVADPDLPNKIARSDDRRVMWCLSCNICLGRASRPETICPVNPGVGRDRALASTLRSTTTQPRRIAIVGSSLSALTAAWIAARRGHHVTVFDAEPIGGMQRWRASVATQREYDETIEAARTRATDAGVRIEPTLAVPDRFELRWVVRRFQPASDAATSAYDVLAGRASGEASTETDVIGADLACAEAAVRLAQSGARVRLRSPGADIALDAHPGFRALNRRVLDAAGALIEVKMPLDQAFGTKRIVSGHPVTTPIAYGADEGWAYPHGRDADAFIDDAYEPGLMTQGVYAAVRLAEQA